MRAKRTNCGTTLALAVAIVGSLCSAPARADPPPTPRFQVDPDGNVVNSWGDASIVQTGPNAGKNAVMPNGTHGCFVDFEDNVWFAGNGDGIAQKYSHDGSALLLQIGTKFLCDDGTATGGACGNV